MLWEEDDVEEIVGVDEAEDVCHVLRLVGHVLIVLVLVRKAVWINVSNERLSLIVKFVGLATYQ